MNRARLTLMLLMLLPLAASLSARDFGGKWTMDGDVQGNAVSLACVVEQAADGKLSGKCLINGMEPAEIDGTAKDAAFKFSFTVQGYTLTYSGTIEGDTVNGDIEVAGVTGKFSGKRA
jgi:hypothetical protein